MATVQLFNREIPANVTIATARDLLRDWLVADAGFTHIKSYLTSGYEYATFTVSGMVGYFSLSITSGGNLSFMLHETFDSSSNSRGTVASSPNGTVMSSGISTSLLLAVHPELLLVRAAFGTTVRSWALMQWQAETRPTWWGAAVPYAQVGYAGTGSFTWSSLNGAPSPTLPGIMSASTKSAGRALTLGAQFTTSSDWLGKTSDDIGILASSGLAALDTAVVADGTQEYLVLDGGSQSLVVRSV